MKRVVILGAIAYVIVTIFLSIFVVKPPKPIIEIKGEPLVTIAASSNEILSFAITNTLLTAWVIMALLLLFCFIATRKIALIPSGLYNFIEAIVELIFGFCTGIAGERNGRRFFPVVATLMLYITFANWFSLTPIFNTVGMFVPLHAEEAHFHKEALVFEGSNPAFLSFGAEDVKLDAEECAAGEAGDVCREHAIEEVTAAHEGKKVGVLFPYLRGINTDLMTPASFAIVAMFFIQYWAISTLGIGTYISKFINFSSPINFFVGFLELVAEFARLISFSFRLFGNMLAGEILLLVMTFLISVATPLLVIFYGLEVFVGMIQAFVFGTLTLVFASMAVAHHGGEEHAHAEEAHH